MLQCDEKYLYVVILVYFVSFSEILDRWSIKEKGIEQNVDVVTPYFFILGELRDMLYLPIPTHTKKDLAYQTQLL
jgi:hypothetical protein